MLSLSYEFNNNVPLFKCNYCGKCSTCIESKNFLNINRGCCWYFPKYTLTDIKNILKIGRKDFVINLFKMPNAEIRHYDIIMHGILDNEQYNEYIDKNNLSEMCPYNADTTDDYFNPKLFFRLCPFFKNNGCSLDYSLRPHPCNLYLCRSILSMSKKEYEPYNIERKDYFAYCNYFNESIKYSLIQNKVNFLNNLEKSISVIEHFDMPYFEPRNLKPICIYPDNHGKAV